MVVSKNLIKPTKSWMDVNNHFLSVVRDPWYRVIMELQHNITIASYEFFCSKGMRNIHLPITTGSISSPMGLGSDSIPVKVNIAGLDTYLADSMQFLLEYGCRLSDKGCFYIMPSFRGEDADARHLCQFFHSEAEVPGNLDDVMKIVEEYVIYLAQYMVSNCSELIKSVTGTIEHIESLAAPNKAIPRITLDEAVELLKNKPSNEQLYKTDPVGFNVITPEGEKVLIKEFNGIVWLTHFDHLAVPFYQAFDPSKTRALNADLLLGIGEVVGCGQRHTNFDEVQEALHMHDVSQADYQWYCDMKRVHPLETSGFGMGIERFILWLLKHDDIRDCQIVPRFNGVEINP